MEDIIIIGTDYEAERFWYLNRENYNVILWLEKIPRRRIFLNHTAVLAYDTFDFKKNKCKIVIATNPEKYLQYANDLMQKGLTEFKDFVYYESVQKDLAIFWGNCQVKNLRDKIMIYPEFSSRYWVYPMVNIDFPVRSYIPVEIFQNCKLFVYQEVKSETNGVFYSSQYMINHMGENTQKIKIPNLFRKGFGFFPQAKYVPLDMMRETERMFVTYSDDHDSVIEEKFCGGEREQEICEAIKYGDVFQKQEIEENFWKYMKLIKDDDEKNDVKIYDFILDNYKKKCIFIDPGHISYEVYEQYISQIFELLEIKFKVIDNRKLKNELIYPIYGCVKRCLGLDWYDVDSTIREQEFTLCENSGGGITIEEYVREYIFLCITR